MAIDLNGSTGISLDDNEKINLGSSNDLQIYHDGSNNRIVDSGTGSLYIQGQQAIILANADATEFYATFDVNGASTLRYDNGQKLATTSTGVDVTGTVTADGLSLGDFADALTIGDSNDLSLYHAGGSSTIKSDTGQLIIRTDALRVLNNANSEQILHGDANGAVTLYHNNASKLATTSTGATIRGDGDAILLLNTASDAGDKSLIRFGDNDDADAGYIDYDHGTNSLAFGVNAAERMRIDSSGNVLVGKTSDAFGTAGTVMRSSGVTNHTVAGTCLNLNRTGSDGAILELYRGGTTIGMIGVDASNYPTIDAQATNTIGLQFGAYVQPRKNKAAQDNFVDIGSGSFRFDDIYATNGTIQTSDFNEKQDIASLTATEMLVGKRISTLFKTFRWKDSVAEKGDNARTHTGVIAQDVQAAFTAEGLDAGDYALFISSTWWETQTDVPAVEAVAEVLDEDGNVTTEAVEAKDAYTRTDTYETEAEAPEGATSKTRMGIRYPELLSFVAAYNEQRFASIEARLTALEA